MITAMPTDLPPFKVHEEPAPQADPASRNSWIATIVAISFLALLCTKLYPPLPGYSLAETPAELQLSP